MGLESYLLYIYFRTPIDEAKIINLFQQAGMTHLEQKYRKRVGGDYGDYFFELRSIRGLIEAHVLLAPEDIYINDFSLRFSILSPNTVIDETFTFLERINSYSEIQVFDTEIRNHNFRRLRQSGHLDERFEGVDTETDEAIDKLCFISLDVKDFKRNEYEIRKRQVILGNENGEIIEGGSATLDLIRRKGLFNRFLGWIKKEM